MYINKFQIALFIAILTIPPSVICFYTYDAFEFPKVYILILLLLTISVISLFKKVIIRISYFDIFFTLFIVISFISSFFSADYMYSFFGYFGNPAGSLFFIYSVFIFLILHKKFLQNIKISTLLKLMLYSGIFPCIYGVLQIFKMDPFNWQTPITDGRVFSTFGQPNFFAIYLGLLLFCSLILYLESKNNYLLVYISIICILLVNTKSLSVFIVTLLCATVLTFFNFKKSKYIFTLVLPLLFLIFFFVSFSRITSQLLGSTSVIKTNDTAKIRLILWQNTLVQTFNIKTILIGNGPENYAFFFKRPYELNTTSEWSLVFFKPHNLFIENLFNVGIVGVVFYLYILIYSISKLKSNNVFIIPIFLLLASFFLWLPSVLYFYLLLIFYYLYDPKKIVIASSHACIYILIPSLYILILSFTYLVSNLFYLHQPCISYNIFPNYQPYIVACGLSNNSDNLVKKGYLSNKLNKIYIEKTGLYFLNNRDLFGEDIFRTAFYRDSNDPIFMYYYGLSTEVFGNKKSALELYKKASENSTNFYLNDAALKRLE